MIEWIREAGMVVMGVLAIVWLMLAWAGLAISLIAMIVLWLKGRGL